jgi:gluconokinase
VVIIVTGVAGSGKTTIGRLLATSLGWEFHDADDLHPASNKDKMSRGIPLTDEDRWPWLRAVRDLVNQCLDNRKNAVIACSALKQEYRDLIVSGSKEVILVYLKGSEKLIARRLSLRKDHFFDKRLLQSQFDALEEPTDATIVDISATPEAVVEEIKAKLDL